MNDEKVRENRLRRMADRQGFKLVKSRRRDERALDYGKYWLADRATNTIEGDTGFSLDEIEWLLSPDEATEELRSRLGR